MIYLRYYWLINKKHRKFRNIIKQVMKENPKYSKLTKKERNELCNSCLLIYYKYEPRNSGNRKMMIERILDSNS